MRLARVTGTVVSSRKDDRLEGSKFLLLQPILADSKPSKELPVVAVDTVGAGVGETVLFTEGSSARRAVGCEDSPTDAAVTGIVDQWDLEGKTYSGE